ncbi:MAG: DNA-binding MarR family transcriptional regulator [Candidatus Azotimanducaceae bacterium]|jgi:DNA-binding MarR family transcriptional regulator
MEIHDDLANAILIEIRRVIRAIYLDSKQMVRQHGVTGPQLVTLRSVARLGPITVTALARSVNLSQPTVTGILARLEQQGLIQRERDSQDRRAIRTTITDKGSSVLHETPKPLEDRFRRKLSQLKDWEQTQTLATLQHIAAMMEAEEINADPILSTDALNSASQDAPVLLDVDHSPKKTTGKK